MSQGPLHRPLTLPDARHAAIVPTVQGQYKLSQQHFGGKIHIATQCSFLLSLSPRSLCPSVPPYFSAFFHSYVLFLFFLCGTVADRPHAFVCAYIYMHLVRSLSTCPFFFFPSLVLNAVRAYRKALAVSWEYEAAFLLEAGLLDSCRSF